MQLFITEYQKEGNEIIISESRVVYQLTHVLRAKPGMQCMVQEPIYASNIARDTLSRYTCEVVLFEKDFVKVSILLEEKYSIEDNNIHLCVSLLNKPEKFEIIVQKCTEIWIIHFVFFLSQYSQLRELSENKRERLQKIALEAVEQSHGCIIPTIDYIPGMKKIFSEWINFLCHQDGENIKNISQEEKKWRKNFFIGPEWWRWPTDNEVIKNSIVKNISLGKNILRSETAAVVTAREAIK